MITITMERTRSVSGYEEGNFTRRSSLTAGSVSPGLICSVPFLAVLTGLANMTLPTLYASDTEACTTMVLYSLFGKFAPPLSVREHSRFTCLPPISAPVHSAACRCLEGAHRPKLTKIAPGFAVTNVAVVLERAGVTLKFW